VGKPSISYAPRPDTTAESELSALANVYEFVLSKSVLAKKASSPPQNPRAATTRRSEYTVAPRRWRI